MAAAQRAGHIKVPHAGEPDGWKPAADPGLKEAFQTPSPPLCAKEHQRLGCINRPQALWAPPGDTLGEALPLGEWGCWENAEVIEGQCPPLCLAEEGIQHILSINVCWHLLHA